MKRAFTLRLCGALSLALMTALPTLAQAAPKVAGTHGDWTVYTRGTGSETICYVLSEAQTMSPSNVNHGDIYFMVSNWKNGAASEQPSFLAGYPLKTTARDANAIYVFLERRHRRLAPSKVSLQLILSPLSSLPYPLWLILPPIPLRHLN